MCLDAVSTAEYGAYSQPFPYITDGRKAKVRRRKKRCERSSPLLNILQQCKKTI